MKNQLLVLIFLMLDALFFAVTAQDTLGWTPVQETETDANNRIAVITGHGDILPEVVVRFVRIEGETGGEYMITDTIANGQFRLEVSVGDDMTAQSRICGLGMKQGN